MRCETGEVIKKKPEMNRDIKDILMFKLWEHIFHQVNPRYIGKIKSAIFRIC